MKRSLQFSGGNISFPIQGEARWRSNGWPSWTSSFHLRTSPSRLSTPTIEKFAHDDLTIYACGGWQRPQVTSLSSKTLPAVIMSQFRRSSRRQPPRQKRIARAWGIRQPRTQDDIERILGNHVPTSMDPIQELRDVAVHVTKPGRRTEAYRESPDVRKLRREALRLAPGDDRKQLWKAMQKQRRSERKRWLHNKLDLAGSGFWQAKKAADSDKRSNSWELRLLSEDDWRGDPENISLQSSTSGTSATSTRSSR